MCGQRAPDSAVRRQRWSILTLLNLVSRPRDRLQNRALVDRLELVEHAAIERDNPSGPQIERASLRTQQHVAFHDLNRHAAVSLMGGNLAARLQRRQDDTIIVELDERFGVLPGFPLGLTLELFDFPDEVELDKRSRQCTRVWSSMLRF